MNEETKLKMMENLLKNARVGQLNMVVESGATVNYYEAGAKENDTMPTAEQMASAVETTLKAGLWWGNTAWSVVFRVMQMMGYKGSITQFIGIAENLALGKDFPYKCNMDAISKPLRNGKISRDLERWQEDGAPKKYIILASSLKEELEKD
jgi:hypothetical protein